MDVLELPRAPKGDFSEPAKAEKPEAAKAEDEVTGSFFGDSSFFESDGFEAASEPNGETAEVFEKALGIEDCRDVVSTHVYIPRLG